MCEKLFIQNDDHPKRMLKQILSINVGIRERYSYSCLRNEMSNKLGVLSFVFARKTQQEKQLRISPGFFGPKKTQISRSRWMSFWCSCQSWYLWPLLYEAFFYGGDFGMATCKVRFPFFFLWVGGFFSVPVGNGGMVEFEFQNYFFCRKCWSCNIFW